MQLFAAFGGEEVELGAAIVLRNAFFGRDPAAFDEAMEGRIERALLDLEHVLGLALDSFGDGMAVGGAGRERAQDEQIEGALQKLDAGRFVFSRHSR